MPFKVGTTPGLHYIARSPELATTIKKLGYVITRGINTLELPLDLPSEVTFTDAKQIRHIAKKQGIEMNVHGDLQIPMGMPERGDWRDAQDRINRSLRSAIYVGATYIDFHASLSTWLELMSHGAGRKLSISFCDHKGRFISDIFKDSEKLRKWLVYGSGNRLMELMDHDILNPDERREYNNEAEAKVRQNRQESIVKRIREFLNQHRNQIKQYLKGQDEEDRLREAQLTGRLREPKNITDNDVPEEINRIVDDYLLRGIFQIRDSSLDKKLRWEIDKLNKELSNREIEIVNSVKNKIVYDKLTLGKEWFFKEMHGGTQLVDAYVILANYLFLEKDPIWTAMAAEYKDLLKTYKIDYNDSGWLDRAYEDAQKKNDREFKEFFYAVVAAKFLEGHMEAAFNWIDKEFIPKELKKLPEKNGEDREFKEECLKTAKKIIIGIENPEAREPHYAGSHLLWKPKQIYAAIKTIRKEKKLSRLMIIMDHEHLATQGVDALLESRADILTKPDFGEMTISIHANHPNPMHPHDVLEFGDVVLYELIYNLVKTGFGKKKNTFLIYERGGGDDPYQRSIDVLRLIAKFVEKEVHPDDLPIEFFGMESVAMGGSKRQLQIISDHKMDPLKDLFEIPEEEWGLLSSAARSKGKAEIFKKGELK